jgi:hypothetical protein
MRSLELQLEALDQRQSGIEDDNADIWKHRANVAELFRLAALIYIRRVARGESAEATSGLVIDAFTVLKRLEYVERPWPLFVVGLEAGTEEQRVAFLAVMEPSVRRQPLGSIPFVRDMVTDGWIVEDLNGSSIDRTELYDMLLGRSRVPVCFT